MWVGVFFWTQCRMVFRDIYWFFLPNVHCYFMKHILLTDIHWFYLTSAFTHCRMCVCHMSLKDLLTYLLIMIQNSVCYPDWSMLAISNSDSITNTILEWLEFTDEQCNNLLIPLWTDAVHSAVQPTVWIQGQQTYAAHIRGLGQSSLNFLVDCFLAFILGILRMATVSIE